MLVFLSLFLSVSHATSSLSSIFLPLDHPLPTLSPFLSNTVFRQPYFRYISLDISLYFIRLRIFHPSFCFSLVADTCLYFAHACPNERTNLCFPNCRSTHAPILYMYIYISPASSIVSLYLKLF